MFRYHQGFLEMIFGPYTQDTAVKHHMYMDEINLLQGFDWFFKRFPETEKLADFRIFFG